MTIMIVHQSNTKVRQMLDVRMEFKAFIKCNLEIDLYISAWAT